MSPLDRHPSNFSLLNSREYNLIVVCDLLIEPFNDTEPHKSRIDISSDEMTPVLSRLKDHHWMGCSHIPIVKL